MFPRVSILIPVYKSEKYIEKCLSTVLGQTYQNLEVIIINDATPDNSMAIVSNMLKQSSKNGITIKTIHHEKNMGIASTRNDLLDNATGDYLYFVDSDDFIAKNAIETLVDIATKTNADIVRSNYYEFKNGIASTIILPTFTSKDDLLRKHIPAWDSIEAMWQLLIRRSLTEDHHIRFAEGINASEDHLMMIKLYYYAKIITEGTKPVYYYRIDNEQSVTHVNPKAFHDSMYKAMDAAITFLKEKGVYDLYREEVLTRTFLTKQTFLLNKENRDIDFYLDEHPECNSYYRKFNYSRSQIILFKLAELGQRRFLKFLTHFI